MSKSWINASSTHSTWVPVFCLWAPQSRWEPCNKRITNSRNKEKQVIWAEKQPNKLLRVPIFFTLDICAFIPLLLLPGLLLQLFYSSWEKQFVSCISYIFTPYSFLTHLLGPPSRFCGKWKSQGRELKPNCALNGASAQPAVGQRGLFVAALGASANSTLAN